MGKEISGSSQEFWTSSRKCRPQEGEESRRESSGEDRYYTQKFQSVCPVDSSKVVHTVRFMKATCTRVDDTVDDFRCSRDGGCVKCTENYR